MIVEPMEVALAAIIFGTTSATILSLARMRDCTAVNRTANSRPGRRGPTVPYRAGG
jgi:hypothetical protein